MVEKDLEQLKILLKTVLDTQISDVVTLRVFCNEYLEYIKENRTENYLISVRTALNHLTNYFGMQRPIRTIELRDTEKFITYLQQNVKKGYRVYYRTLKAAFNKAADWKYIDENYFLKIKIPKKQKTAPHFINEKDLTKILGMINNENVKDVVKFAFYTGMRLGEIVNLRWKNVNFTERVIAVGDDEFITKGKNQRFIPINDDVMKILEKRVNKKSNTNIYKINDKNKGYIFGSKKGYKYTGDYFSKKFKEACRAAGMDEAIHFHTLRHSFASNLVQRGATLYVVKELLGHSSISTTEIYSHLNIENLRAAVELL